MVADLVNDNWLANYSVSKATVCEKGIPLHAELLKKNKPSSSPNADVQSLYN